MAALGFRGGISIQAPEAVERAFERLRLSGDFAVNEPKRLPPARESATFKRAASVSH
jgi:hypothetical protein